MSYLRTQLSRPVQALFKKVQVFQLWLCTSLLQRSQKFPTVTQPLNGITLKTFKTGTVSVSQVQLQQLLLVVQLNLATLAFLCFNCVTCCQFQRLRLTCRLERTTKHGMYCKRMYCWECYWHSRIYCIQSSKARANSIKVWYLCLNNQASKRCVTDGTEICEITIDKGEQKIKCNLPAGPSGKDLF